jgi:Outer membrane protein beta-barrel domain
VKQLLSLVAVLGILAVPAVAHAQVGGGVRAGLNLADLAFDPSPPVDSKFLNGLVVGVFATIPVNDVVAFQPEGLFSMQGTKFTEEGVTVKTKIDYFQIPLLGRFRVAKGSPVAVLVGPSLGFKTNASFDGPGVPAEFSQDFEDSVKAFDFGIVAGVTADVGRYFVVDGRYTWGLTNIAKNSDLEPGETEGSAKHRVLSLSAGIRF